LFENGVIPLKWCYSKSWNGVNKFKHKFKRTSPEGYLQQMKLFDSFGPALSEYRGKCPYNSNQISAKEGATQKHVTQESPSLQKTKKLARERENNSAQ